MNKMDEAFLTKLTEIQRLLEEAYRHYFKYSDGLCKSCEGRISIHLPEYFWAHGKDKKPEISIYSYVLGPNRNHDFANIDKALDAVRKWHKREMEQDYSDGDDDGYIEENSEKMNCDSTKVWRIQ
jgi:hypothetical protein